MPHHQYQSPMSVCAHLRLQSGPAGVEARVVEVAGELLPELLLDADPRPEALQLVAQPPVGPLAVAGGLRQQGLQFAISTRPNVLVPITEYNGSRSDIQ